MSNSLWTKHCWQFVPGRADTNKVPYNEDFFFLISAATATTEQEVTAVSSSGERNIKEIFFAAEELNSTGEIWN